CVIAALAALAERGASVLVVEHDLDVIAHADWVIDLGPGAGPDGGEVVAEGTPAELARRAGKRANRSRTADALAARAAGASPGTGGGERAVAAGDSEPAIAVVRAREHNLKNVSCAIPHGQLTVVTGPSGSGKSSLAFDVVLAEG